MNEVGRHIPRKSLGQHFLHDPGMLARIVAAIRPQANDLMVEIGPGLGALTRPLLERLARLHIVELDRDLAARWRAEAAAGLNIVLHEADALRFDFATLLPPSPLEGPARRAQDSTQCWSRAKRGMDRRSTEGRGEGASPAKEKLRIVGNLPYNISTPLLFHLADYAEHIHDMHFMLQKEVVDRMAAAPNTAEYGRLTVMLQARFRVEKLFDVPPGCFNPPPRVDSAVARLVPLPAMDIPYRNPERFAAIVARAFGQRRKTLRNTLKGLVEADVFERLGIDPGRRGETLTVQEFADLADT